MSYGIAYKFLQAIVKRFFPSYFTNQVMDELVIYKTRLQSKKIINKYKGKKDLKLNVGCGTSGMEGWINIDAIYSQGVNCIWDCRTSLPFDSDSATGIFTEHFIEHIDFYDEAPKLFKDIYRVLKKGAVVRIIVPDAQKYLEAYNKHGWENISEIRPLLDGHIDAYTQQVMHTKMELVNWIFRQQYQHKFAYDFETMNYLLREAGFRNVIKQDFNLSLNSALLIDKPSRASESLYVEAMKE